MFTILLFCVIVSLTKADGMDKRLLLNDPDLKIGGEVRYSGRISSSWSTTGIHRVNLVTNPMISHEWGKDQELNTTIMFTILLFCVIVSLTKADGMDKRLLLNDPDVVASRLRNLELTIQSLQSTVAKLESKNAETSGVTNVTVHMKVRFYCWSSRLEIRIRATQ
jgi:hypothetical protein